MYKVKEYIGNNKAFVLAMSVLIVLNIVSMFFVTPIHIYGQSMEPTYHDGQNGFSMKSSLCLQTLERFDIVIIKNDQTNQKSWIKRIVGMPNETIECKDNTIYIDGKAIKQPFLDEVMGQTSDFGPLVLEDDEYFVLGDNRMVSSDSRVIGPVKKEEIVAKGAWVI